MTGLSVLAVAPGDGEENWLYASCGGSGIPHVEPCEFVVVSPVEEALHVELLSWLVNYHADSQTGLGIGSIVDIGRPWLENSLCDHLLIAAPYFVSPRVGSCEHARASPPVASR